MDVKEIGWDGMDWFHLAQDGDFWQTHQHGIELSGSLSRRIFLD
jgi:hypothetical protein